MEGDRSCNKSLTVRQDTRRGEIGSMTNMDDKVRAVIFDELPLISEWVRKEF